MNLQFYDGLLLDILSIQVMIVALESGFCTCGRILDVYRIRLNTSIVEASVSIQDWVRTLRKPIIDDDEDILMDDDITLGSKFKSSYYLFLVFKKNSYYVMVLII